MDISISIVFLAVEILLSEYDSMDVSSTAEMTSSEECLVAEKYLLSPSVKVVTVEESACTHVPLTSFSKESTVDVSCTLPLVTVTSGSAESRCIPISMSRLDNLVLSRDKARTMYLTDGDSDSDVTNTYNQGEAYSVIIKTPAVL